MAYIGSPAAPTIATVSDDTITTAKLADDAVTSAKLDTNIDVGGTLDVTGALTADSNATVAGNLIVDTNTLYVDATNNNVGVGTTGPDSTNKLTVAGDLAVHWASDTFIGMKYQAGATNKMGLVLNDGTRECKVLTKAADNDDKITFHTGSGPTERMRINSGGQVFVNTTSAAEGGEKFCLDFSSNSGPGIILQDTTIQNNSTFIGFHNGSSRIGGIYSNGTTGITYSTSSDYRLKENVIEVTDGIDRVKLLKPSRFNFIVDPNTTVDGFLAHEVADVVPEAISGTKDEVDADGNPKYQGIDQSKLVPLLTAALQEAIAKIESLETEMIAVKSRLDALESA